MNKTACIDIGSNSVRLLMPKPDLTINNKELISTRLAEGLIKTGTLRDEAMTRTRDAVVSLYKTAKFNGYTTVKVFATAAVRTASNGGIFCAMLNAEGINVTVLDGDTEAELGFKGALMGLNNSSKANSDAIVFDIGGASTEIVYGSMNGITYKKSISVGMVVLRDIADTDKTAIECTLDKYFAGFSQVSTFAAAPLYGIGGTATSLASMALHLEKYSAAQTHGYFVSLDDLNRMEYDVFNTCEMNCEKILNMYNIIGESRAMVIGHGIITAKKILTLLKADGFTVSETDNMEAFLGKSPIVVR